MATLSRIKKKLMICLVTPDGKPVMSLHDVILFESKKNKILYKSVTDGAGKIVVPAIDDLNASMMLEIEIRQSQTGKLVKTHRMLYEPNSGFQLEKITLSLDPKKVEKGLQARVPQRNNVTFQWRASIRKRLQSKVGKLLKEPLVPRKVDDAILDLNNAYHLAQRVLAGDFNAASPFFALIGHRQNSAPFPGFRSELGTLAFGFPQNHDLPCVFEDGGALDVAFAGLLLDVHRAEVLGDLTQPGAYAELSSAFLHDRHQSLQAFAGAVVDMSEGRISEEAYYKRVFGDGDEAVPFPDEAQENPGLPRPGGLSPQPLSFGRPQSSVSFDFGGGRPCDLMWVDCVDEIVEAASSYVPPSLCSDEETIGSLSPQATCRGGENVDIEIRPLAGKSFTGDAVKCNVFLQRLSTSLGVAAQKTKLNILSYSSNLVKVRLEKAEKSGCIGFRGTGGGLQVNTGFVRSCLKLGRIHNRVLDRFFSPGFTGLRLIQCTGRNQFSVLSEPVLDVVTLDGENGHVNLLSGNSVSLIEEACTDVHIQWRFLFDDPHVNAADFIHVSVVAGSTTIASDLGAEDSLTVNEQDDQTYTLKAVASTGGNTCGELEITVAIDRYEVLHLQGADRVQSGQTLALSVDSSCPAPTGGLSVQLHASDSNLLEVPATVIILVGQTTVAFDALGKGSSCASVDLTASADAHLADTRAVEIYAPPQLSSLTPQQVQVCDTTNLTVSGTCFKEGETSVRAIRNGVLQPLPVVSMTSTQIVAEVSGLDTGEWRIEVVSRGLISQTLSFRVVSSPAIVEDFQALVIDPPSGDDTQIVPCATNWTAVSWRLRNSSRVEVRLNGTLIHEEDLAGCGGPFEDLFTRPVEEQAVYQLTAFPVGGGTPENRIITLGTGGVKKLTLNNTSNKDLVVWVYDGTIIFADDIPQDSPKHDLAAGGSLELDFVDCDFKDISCVDKAVAEAEKKDPYGNAVTVNHLIVFNVWDIVGATNGLERSVTI